MLDLEGGYFRTAFSQVTTKGQGLNTASFHNPLSIIKREYSYFEKLNDSISTNKIQENKTNYMVTKASPALVKKILENSSKGSYLLFPKGASKFPSWIWSNCIYSLLSLSK